MGWSHGKRWTDDEIIKDLLQVALIAVRIPNTKDLISQKEWGLLSAIRRREGIKKWQARLNKVLLDAPLPRD